MKKYFSNTENRIIAVMFGITMIVALSPLMSRYCINGHDLEYHLLRIEALKEQILMGKPFSKVDSLFFGGAGYASSMFYSNFLLMIPALLRVMGVSIGASYHIFVAICMILTFFSAYYCGKMLTKSKTAGLLCGMMLTLCPYHMDDVMVRAAVGEYMAFIFVPIIIAAIYNIIYEQMNKPYLFALGYAGVLLSHTATTVLCVFATVVIFAFKIKVFLKNTRILGRLALTSAVTLLLTSYYWLPMLEQFASCRFHVSDNWSDLLNSAVNFSSIFSESFPCLGIFLIFFAVLRVFVSKKDTPLLAYADILTILAAICALCATNLMPWERVARYFAFLQFPWRLFVLSSTLLAVSDAIILYAVYLKITREEGAGIKPYTAGLIVTVSVFVLMGSASIYHMTGNLLGYYDYSDDYYSYKPFTASVIGGEWLPESVESVDSILEMSEHAISSTGADLSFERVKGQVKIDVPVSFEYVDVPLIYYKGYAGRIETAMEDSYRIEDVKVTGDGDNGFVRVYLTDNLKGKLTVYYKGTMIQKVSTIISLLTLLILAVIGIRMAVRSKKNSSSDSNELVTEGLK